MEKHGDFHVLRSSFPQWKYVERGLYKSLMWVKQCHTQLGMVTIPPMVMTGGWFIAVLPSFGWISMKVWPSPPKTLGSLPISWPDPAVVLWGSRLWFSNARLTPRLAQPRFWSGKMCRCDSWEFLQHGSRCINMAQWETTYVYIIYKPHVFVS